MRFQRINLSVSVGALLQLREPLWVASSHHTSKESAIDAWQPIEPAALTLKTSKGVLIHEEKPTVRFLLWPSVPRFGKSLYCDGPKQEELLTYERTAELLAYARSKLPKTRVGVSVLAGADEDYPELRRACADAAFYELNLKYSFRVPPAGGPVQYLALATEHFRNIITEIRRFCSACPDATIFIKIPRELSWAPGTAEQVQLLEVLSGHGRAGLILANSQKIDIPPFLHDGQEKRLTGGVLCGETLFDETISLVGNYRPAADAARIPIVASGGMMSEQQILHAFRAGAYAVQLCTTFDYNRISFYETLRSALTARIYIHGLNSFEEYRERLPNVGVAAIYSVPFTYLGQFWSAEAQAHIKDDIRRSEVMDVIVMSGYTLSERWEEVLRQRFSRNLGMRLLMPNPDADVYKSVQRSWGIKEGAQMEARQSRVREAAVRYRQLWDGTVEARATGRRADEPEAKLDIQRHDQCPFYSCYIFDDNAYVSPYPFTRPGELESPVYVFFRSSEEYKRLEAEFDRLRSQVLQTQKPGPQKAENRGA